MNVILQYLLDGIQESDASLQKDAEQLSQWLKEHAGQLHEVLSGQSNETWKKADVLRAMDRLLRDIRPRSHAIRLIGLFANAVASLNDRRKAASLRLLYIPGIPNIRRRPTNPSTAETPKLIHEARQMRTALVEMLCNPAAESAMSLLIPSVILFGGLPNKDLLVALVRALARPGMLPCGGRPQIELRVAWGNQADAEKRLWHPDVVSSLLLLRLRTQLAAEVHVSFPEFATDGVLTDKQIAARLWTTALVSWRKRSRAFGYAPESLAAVLRRAEALYRLDLPGMVVAYMTRDFLSNSVRPATLGRIHGLSIPEGEVVTATTNEVAAGPDTEPEPESTLHNYETIEPKWADGLRCALRKRGRAPLLQALNEFVVRCPHPSGKRTGEFAVFLLKGRSAANHSLATSSVLRYTRIVANRLAPLLEDADPKDLSTATLLSTYLKILEDADAEGTRKNLRRVVASALYEFHIFLSKAHQVEGIDPRELGIGQMTGGSVDANLITESEYQAMRTRILAGASTTLDPAFYRAAALVLMLGFRCGMRRGEILWLRFCDLIVDPYTQETTEIIVRPWEKHDLKSRNASRRLPVEALLDKQERADLEWWRNQYAPSKKSSGDELLFGGLSTTGDLAPEIRIFSIVLDAVRDESGDMALRFHHCRHSAATHLLLRLLLRETPISEDSLPARLLAGRPVLPSSDFLYRVFCGVQGPTRKVLYAISMLIGHSSPEITLEHYIHCMDSLQAVLLDRRTIPHEKKVLESLSGLSRSAAYGSMSAHGKMALVKRLMPPPPPPASRETKAIRQQAGLWMDQLWEFLYRADDPSRQVPVEDLAAEYGLDCTRACLLIDRAIRMRDQTVNPGRFTFPMTTISVPEKRRLYCPRKPHMQANRNLANTLAPAMRQVLERNPRLAAKALETWAERANGHDAHIRFQDFAEAAEARNYRDFLAKLGLSYRWIIGCAGDHRQQLELWRKKIGIKESETIRTELVASRSAQGIVKWVDIEPYFPEILEVAGTSGINGYEAFRYVQMMAWIDLA